MEVRAIARNIPMSSRKVRLIVNLIRGRRVNEALDILRFTPKAAALPVAKVIASAAANAENRFEIGRNRLHITYITADEAPSLKRGQARARGRYDRIVKRSSHITVVVSDEPLQRPRNRVPTYQ
ncbi:MAG: 50S ribosomal protein L22 [Chloroflexi bacterium]|nr:50S ribosomal protein L22 [Chloroflexota bacterium]MCL5946692.1 50S ribosomal protein L22 [Chloroflexota bacterium]